MSPFEITSTASDPRHDNPTHPVKQAARCRGVMLLKINARKYLLLKRAHKMLLDVAACCCSKLLLENICSQNVFKNAIIFLKITSCLPNFF